MSTHSTQMVESLSNLEAAVQSFITSAKASSDAWLTAPAPGKWSPSQVSEHVARSLEEAANDIEGKETRMLNVPFFLKPITRMLFNNVIKKGKLNKAKTNPAMNPKSGPATPEEGALRLQESLDRLKKAAALHAEQSAETDSVVFGKVPLDQYIRFQEIHTTHHRHQLPAA